MTLPGERFVHVPSDHHSRGQKQIITNKMDAIQNLYILFIQNKKKEAQLDIAPVQQVPCLVILRK